MRLLDDLTLVVAIAYDIPERERNHRVHRDFWASRGIDVIYQQVDYDPMVPFHRTKLLNQGLKQATTRFVGVTDVDCLFELDVLKSALELVDQGTFVIPFDEVHHIEPGFDVNEALADQPVKFRWNKPPVMNWNTLHKHHYQGDFQLKFDIMDAEWPSFQAPTGLCFLADREQYRDLGWENQHCIDYAFEDIERVVRCEMLGQPVVWMPAVGYHLTHSNSTRIRNPLFKNNFFEFMKVCNMTEDELRFYISTWGWT